MADTANAAQAGRPPHRPTKKTAARVRRLLSAIRAGNTYRASTAYAGISEDTLARWLRDDAAFADSVTRAEADAERALVARIRAAARTDWKAASHLLACRWPDDWSQRARVEIDIHTRAAQLAQAYGLDPQDVLNQAMQWLAR